MHLHYLSCFISFTVKHSLQKGRGILSKSTASRETHTHTHTHAHTYTHTHTHIHTNTIQNTIHTNIFMNVHEGALHLQAGTVNIPIMQILIMGTYSN
jgi:hypothetical protein